jgi:hypothetical protein
MKKLFVVALVAVLALTPFLASAQGEEVKSTIDTALRSYNYSHVLELAERFASLGSRAPGYPGYERALELIVGEAQRLGLKYTIQNFTMLAPVRATSSTWGGVGWRTSTGNR